MANLLLKKKSSGIWWKIIFFVLIVLISTSGIFGFYLVKSGQEIYAQGQETVAASKRVYQLIKNQDIVKADEELRNVQKKLIATQLAYKKISFLRILPYVGAFISDGEHFLKAGEYGLEAGKLTTEAIKPYVDVLGLKGQGSFVMGSAEERIQKAVQTLDKLIPKTDLMVEKMVLMNEELEKIDESKYFFKVKGIDPKAKIKEAKTLISQTIDFIQEAKPAIKVLPKLLGEPNEIRYLLLFQNDKELRSTGGFITAYALFSVKSGKIEVVKSEDIYELDKRIQSRLAPPEMVLKYLKNVYYWNARDTNLLPDFKISMDKFYELYKKDNSEKIGGIIALDTQFFVSILKIVGPIDIYGIKFSADKEPKCNCPQAVYELERYATTQVDYVRDDRKDIIGKLMFELMKKVLSSPPKQYWGPIFQTGIENLKQKHILVYLFDKEGQKGIEALNWGGRIKDTDGDYLHVNDTNLGGAKTNMFLSQKIEQKIEVKKDKVEKTVVIKYSNPFPASNCNLEQKEVLCLNSLYRSVVRLYVPKGSKLIEKETRGSETKVKTYDELGKTVFEAFFTMYPQHQATLEFKYEVPIVFDRKYQLLIQKQPGLTSVPQTVTVNGQTQMFDLTEDRILEFQL